MCRILVVDDEEEVREAVQRRLQREGYFVETAPIVSTFTATNPMNHPRIHVDHDNLSAKFWLLSISLAQNLGFRPKELRQVQALVEQNQEQLMEAWNEYFGIG